MQSIDATYPSLWLKKYPPTNTMGVRQFTSWSCHHGVVRWMGACGCTPHGEWKAPLRTAINEIAGLIDNQFFDFSSRFVKDPLELRHAYIKVVLGEIPFEELVAAHAKEMPKEDDLHKIKLLLAAQYEKQRMFTSCGWFFDDFDRIEPRNNVSYTAQAVWFTYLATGVDLTDQAAALLKKVQELADRYPRGRGVQPPFTSCSYQPVNWQNSGLKLNKHSTPDDLACCVFIYGFCEKPNSLLTW